MQVKMSDNLKKYYTNREREPFGNGRCWPALRLSGTEGRSSSHQQRRSEEHTSELQSRETISYAVFCLKKKKKKNTKKKKKKKKKQKEYK